MRPLLGGPRTTQGGGLKHLYLHLLLYLYSHLPVIPCKARLGKGLRDSCWQRFLKHSALLRQDAEYLPTCMVHLPPEGVVSASLGEVMQGGAS